MKTTVATMKTVRMVTEGQVSFRNLVVRTEDASFSMEFAFREDRRTKFDYQSVSGHLTPELYNWFTDVLIRPLLEGDVSSNVKTSPFKLYLDRKGIEFKKGILRTMVWECDNKSENFDDCPFRLTISEKFGTASLALVYKNPKIVVGERMNIETGRIEKEYGYYKYENMKKEYFRRLEIITYS